MTDFYRYRKAFYPHKVLPPAPSTWFVAPPFLLWVIFFISTQAKCNFCTGLNGENNYSLKTPLFFL